MLWGTSWSGGHIVYVAADDGRIAAVISQTPDLDGARTLLEIARYGGVGQLARVTAHGIRDAAGALRGREPAHDPDRGARPADRRGDEQRGGRARATPRSRDRPGATRSAPGPSCTRAGTARSRRIGELSCPILIQIAERDSIAPPGQAKAAAWRAKGRSEVREYPCAHFDIYVGRWRERAIEDQLHFLRRHLASRP